MHTLHNQHTHLDYITKTYTTDIQCVYNMYTYTSIYNTLINIILYMWWGYGETFFLLAKENEKSEILKCGLFLLSKVRYPKYCCYLFTFYIIL
jgi:hypothetical protein